jgi:hypothetical protein
MRRRLGALDIGTPTYEIPVNLISYKIQKGEPRNTCHRQYHRR